ncbi:RNA polymerase sigma factor [Streptomyces sp. MAR4 CNX-425]|uniref:RNA polymerase sigma factor n=1 Tax=Streptomyces sp. MAR4 CNX-425 TaxID=3406343 RepID=UPI003B50382A
MLASLVGYLGDFDRAEEAAQEAFATAAERWSADDMPANPGAWLVTTARRRALDRIRRDRAPAGKSHLPLPEAAMATNESDDVPGADVRGAGDGAGDGAAIRDERLELIFTCCHPALPPEGRVALTLRALGGLATADIARAFAVPEATMRRRLTRARAEVKASGIPFAVPGPPQLPERLDAVLSVIHLIFNEGRRGRVDLGAEALRLGRVLTDLLPREPETHGLLALMTLHHARRRARSSGDGAGGGGGDGRWGDRVDLVVLYDQGRSREDWREIARGRAVLDGALALGGRGPYVLRAAIAALQTRERIDWPRVARLYGRLADLTRSPVVELNRAVAIARAGAPHTALRVIDRLDLDGYLYLHSTRGELLSRLGHTARARDAYRRALDLATTPPERRFLTRRLEQL